MIVMDATTIIGGLVLVDVTATIAGNYAVWRRISKIETVLAILCREHVKNHGGQEICLT